MVFDLQVDQPDLVAGVPRRRGDQLEPERLEPQKDFRVEQRPGMNAEKPHRTFPLGRIAAPHH